MWVKIYQTIVVVSMALYIFVLMVQKEDKPRHFHNINFYGITPTVLKIIVTKQAELRFSKGRKVSLSEAISTIIKEYGEYIGQR
jgi:hypothetical protein